MNFAYTILYVEDVPKTIEFYEKAFGFETKMLHEGGDYGEINTGTTTLAFSSRELMKQMGKTPSVPDATAPAFEIAFTTDDVQASIDKAILAGANLVQSPEKMPWGQTISYVTDNSGFLVEICTSMAG